MGHAGAPACAIDRRMLRFFLLCVLAFALGVVSMDGYAAYKQPSYKQERPTRGRRILPMSLARARSKASDVDQFKPLPEVFAGRWAHPEAEEITLGRMLFFDRRLSRNHDISCNDCHPLDRFGMDGRGVSIGHVGQTGRRNAPTVYNAAGHGMQFWDGRASDVEEQALMPLVDPGEMAMSEQRVMQTVRAIPDYVSRFEALYPQDTDPVSFDNVGRVIGAFERGLVTPGRWDRFLNGERTALTVAERRGLSTFVGLGCPTCHAGALVGGTHFEQLGQFKPWPNQQDKGAGQGSGSLMFKVASLRNVEKTAPYFHDASADTLEAAVRKMAAYQLGIDISEAQLASVVTWLKSLTGTLPHFYIEPPTLPPNTDALPQATRDGY